MYGDVADDKFAGPFSTAFRFSGLSRQELHEIYSDDSGRPSAELINSLSNYIYAAPVDAR